MRKGTSFRKGKKTRKIDREKVFEIVKSCAYGIDTHEIARRMRKKIHCISGRLSELEQQGVIYQRARIFKDKKRSCTIWIETPSELIESRKAEVFNRRLLRWIAQGEREGFVTKTELKHLKVQGKLF